MYNYSARRKQGLGSLRPGYYSGGPADILVGNLMNWGIGKMFGTQETAQQKLDKQMAKFIYGHGNQKDDNTSQGFTSTPSAKSRIGGGILNALATMILGPIMGPIAMTLGRGLKNKYTGGDGGSGFKGPGPKGPKGPGPQIDWYTGSDEEDKDIENQIKDFSGIDSSGWDPGVKSLTANEGPSNEGRSGGGGRTGQEGSPEHGGQSGSPSTAGAGMSRSDDSWSSSPFFKGGRVSYSQGGLASLWQR